MSNILKINCDKHSCTSKSNKQEILTIFKESTI